MNWIFNILPFLQIEGAEVVTEATEGTAEAVAADPFGGMTPILLMAGVILVMYIFVMRPQNKAQKEKEKMRKELSKGDRIETIGGVRGTVKRVKDDGVIVEVADNCDMEFAKFAIGENLTLQAKKLEEKEKK